MAKRRKGFTLIELLVVITIIAVLAAILFPVFLMARAKARAMNCLANLKQFGATFAMYQGDYDGTYPYTSMPSSAGYDTLGSNVPNIGDDINLPTYRQYKETWVVKLESYIMYTLVDSNTNQPYGIMKCKEIPGKRWLVSTGYPDEAGYGYNFLYLGMPFKPYSESNDTDWNQYLNRPTAYSDAGFMKSAAKQTSIEQPGETILLVENAYIWAFPPRKANGTTLWAPVNKTIGNSFIRPRHAGGTITNVLWCDGHATAMQTRYLVSQAVQYGDKTTARGDSKGPNSQRGAAPNNSIWDLQ